MPVLTSPVNTTSQSDIDLIVHANHWNPFAVLGHSRAARRGGGAGHVGRPRFLARGAVGLGR